MSSKEGRIQCHLTHTNLFAAVCSSAWNVNDQVSTSLKPDWHKGAILREYRIAQNEDGHGAIGATLRDPNFR